MSLSPPLHVSYVPILTNSLSFRTIFQRNCRASPVVHQIFAMSRFPKAHFDLHSTAIGPLARGKEGEETRAVKRSPQLVNLQRPENLPNQSTPVLAIASCFHHTARHRVNRRGDTFRQAPSTPPQEAPTCAGFSS